MSELKLVAKVEHEEGGETFLVRCPAVGVVDALPRMGHYMNPEEPFLLLRVLGRRHAVQLPRNVQGFVIEQMIQGTTVAVEFNQPLFRIGVGGSAAAEAEAAARAPGSGLGGDDLIPVPSPSEGIFYRKPSPDSPCYVEVGSKVSQGTVLGLVEVMKSFNQITYGGTGLPESGTVAKILVEDSAEVAFGQALVMIKAD